MVKNMGITLTGGKLYLSGTANFDFESLDGIQDNREIGLNDIPAAKPPLNLMPIF